MESIFLKVPKIDELHYRKEWLKDEKTMSYNAGYDMELKGYDKKTGTITKNDEEMITWYKKWIGQEPSKYFAYIYEYNNNIPIGEVYFYKSEIEYKMGILIKNEYRGKGYSKEALIILLKIAFEKYGISELTDIVSVNRISAIKLFESCGFLSNEDIEEIVFDERRLAKKFIITRENYLENKNQNMKFVDNLALGKRIILEKYPKFTNSYFQADDSGWTNFAIKVDNKYIFRFPKDYEAYRVIEMEYYILDELNSILPNYIRVPQYEFSNLSEFYPFVGYEMIQGKFITKEMYEMFQKEEKAIFIKQISEFLNILHSIDINKYELDFVEPISNYKMRYEEFKNTCFKYFSDEEKRATIKLFENYFIDKNMINYKPTVIHGDLSEDHIIITNDGIGIIDFGDVRVFDPAYDFIWAYLYDEKLFDKIYENYKVNKDNFFKYRIKEFYIKRTAYYGIVYADKINDKQLLEKEMHNLRKYLLK